MSIEPLSTNEGLYIGSDTKNRISEVKKELVNEYQIQTDQSKEVSKQELEEVVGNMNKFLNSGHTSLKFELHEELNEYYVTIVDEITNELIREIPSKKLLDIYAAMTEFVGMIVDKKI